MNPKCLLGVALFLAAPLATAGTIDVGPPGSGAAFNSIQTAVIAAVPGDVILVQPGSYSSTGSLVIDKSLTIIGAGSSLVTLVASGPTNLSQPTSLIIRDLKPTDEVRVAGLRISTVTTSFGLVGPTTLIVTDCEGAVFLSDIFSNSGSGGSGALIPSVGSLATGMILTSKQVTMDACDFRAYFDTPSGPTGTPLFLSGQAGLLVVNSELTLNDCTISGADGGLGFGNSRSGGKGVSSLGSTVRVSRSEIHGGIGGADWFGVSAGAGAPAISGTTSELYLRGGSGNLFRGGGGGASSFTVPRIIGPGAPAVFVAVDSLATTAGDVILTVGADGDGVTTGPTVDVNGAFVPFGENLANLTVSPRIAALGASATLQFGGEQNSVVLPFFSQDQTLAINLAGIFGEVLVDPSTMTILQPAVLDATGSGQFTFNLPTSPTFVGSSALFQMLALSPSGLASFSNASMLAIF